MSFGVNPAKNMEVYNPSFDRGNESLKSRENLIQTEKLERIDVVESLEENFAKIEETAKVNLEEAKIMAKGFLMKKEYFAKVGGIEPVMLNFIMDEAEKLFTNYFASLEAANKKMQEKLTFELEINKEIEVAQTPEELKNLQSVKQSKISQIMQSYNRMSELYHLAEKKIGEVLSVYSPRKNNLDT